MKKIVFIIISVVVGILVYQKNNEIIIPSDAIRIRIVANSNSINDLYEKKKLKEEIKNEIYKMISMANTTMEADIIIRDNLDEIKELISSKTSDFTINYGLNYFPRKEYKGVIYPDGDYQAIVITLGAGLGDNWWCVLYPPLCMIEDNNNTEDVNYRLLVADLINN